MLLLLLILGGNGFMDTWSSVAAGVGGVHSMGPIPLNREFSLCTIATNTDRIHPCTAFEYYIIARIHKCSDVNNF